MLSAEENRQIEAAVRRAATRPDPSPAEIAQLLTSLPPGREALERALAVASELRWAGRLPLVQAVARFRPGIADVRLAAPLWLEPDQLDELLASPAPYPHKVDALMSAIRAGRTDAVPVVRARMSTESNPFILATFASALGLLGDASDSERLVPLLRHPDTRVVANALEAMQRLAIQPPLALLTELVEASDMRIRTNALALFGRTNARQVLERLPPLCTAPDVSTRTGAAYLLGELAPEPRARELLLEMLEREERAPVLRRVAASLRRHASRRTAEPLLGPLWEQKQRSSGAKQAVIAMLIQEVAVEVGWVESQVVAAGRAHQQRARSEPLNAEDTVRIPPPVEPPPPAPSAEDTIRIDPPGTPAPPAPPAAPPAPPAEPPAPVVPAFAAPGPQDAPTRPPPRGPTPTETFQHATTQRIDVGALIRAEAPVRPAPDEPPPRAWWPRVAAAAALLALLAWGAALSGPTTRVPPPAPGPRGSTVDVEGEVVSSEPGRLILNVDGRYYLIRGDVRGTVGARLRARGTLSGVGPDGLVFVEGKV